MPAIVAYNSRSVNASGRSRSAARTDESRLIVAQDLHGLVQASCNVQRAPLGQVGTQRVEVDDTVLN